ncbi:AAA family ATPase [Chitinimonas sp. BJB300]|uniref:AAA family ATPase n=1 Tax=Chitinimonas sp. BJB300 TaxID=1559339 RepID=UPI000C0E7F7C|nr:AAA family ATPase [Chitinimonas sp. BJB300]PHV11066.1 ATPase [Chitinimonas sp. BJB300]TSJ91527.1 AAA family ATPase [Chitinimonas sp. BJB300]
MYLEHFGLAEPPFRITPHTEFFYQGAERGTTLEALQYAILHGEGLVKLTGEVGAGKTMLCRVLMERLPPNIELAYLANPSLSRDEILLTIADELKLDLANTHNRIRALQDALIARYAAGRQVVVLIDEAHAMPVESLEEIRLLSNLEHGHHKLMQIVLVGQPELDTKLGEQHMRQLRERITHSFQLAPLRQRDVGEYLMFRMRTAGYRGPNLFTPRAERMIAKESEGLTRRLNILADKALISAFAAGHHQIGIIEARAAIKDSNFRQRTRGIWHKSAMTLGILLLGLLTGAAGAHWLDLPAQFIKHTANVKPAKAAPPAIHPAPQQPTLTVTPAPPSAPPIDPTTESAPTPEAQAAPLSPQAPESLFIARLEESRNVMSRQSAEHYTVLLSAAPRDARKELANLLVQAARKLPIDGLYLYPTTNRNGVPYYGLSYGVFTDQASAAQALAKLPEELRRDHPLLRSIGGIRSEMWRE